MKFSEQWLRTWVNPSVTTRALADQLTMAGLEVESLAPAAADFKGVVAGKLADVQDHPGSEHLRICTVDVGAGASLKIVTAAAAAPGLTTAVAPAGAVLEGGPVTAADCKGIASQGVLCSLADLGLGEEKDALLTLPGDTPPGTDVRELLQADDVVIEIGITPNRGDCLSIAGIAREVAAINDAPVTAEQALAVTSMLVDRVTVDVQAPAACPRYVGRVIKGINAAAVTPVWLQERLRRGGIRCVSPVVDVTNYVMLEFGQPMHAFDMDKLDGGIRVRMGEPGEHIALLDGQTVAVQENTLIIADHGRAIALAGIMGGADTAVEAATTALFLESAYFTPAATAGQARRYTLQTESSYRFERGVDPQLARKAIERATALLLEIVGGKPGPVTEAVSHAHLPQPAVIILQDAYLRRTLGADVPKEQVTQILTRLGMTAMREGRGWRVTPPSHRFDIQIEADLVEEIARLYGYERLPQSRPPHHMAITAPPDGRIKERVRTLLADRGYQEVVTYSFVDPELQAVLNPDCPAPRLKNPISEDMAVMRSNLWPGLVQAVRFNVKRQVDRMRVYEIAPRYQEQNRQVVQETSVAGAVYGPLFPEQWSGPRRAGDFFDAKSDVEAVLGLCGAAAVFEPRPHPALHPGQSAAVYLRDPRRQLGWLGVLHPGIQRKLDLPGQPLVVFELCLDDLDGLGRPYFRELSRFPSVRRDIAVVVDVGVPAQALCDSVRSAAGKLLQNVQLFDVYQGEHLELGRKSIALGLTLQDFSRTLTDGEVEEVVDAVVKRLYTDFSATLRE